MVPMIDLSERGIALAGERQRARIEASRQAARHAHGWHVRGPHSRGWHVGLAASIGGLAVIATGLPLAVPLLLGSGGVALLHRS
jgi:hypothetical protein